MGGENFLMRGEEGEARPGTNWKQGYQRGKSLPGGQRGLRAVSLTLSYRPDRYLPQCLPGFAPAVSKAPRDGSGKRCGHLGCASGRRPSSPGLVSAP